MWNLRPGDQFQEQVRDMQPHRFFSSNDVMHKMCKNHNMEKIETMTKEKINMLKVEDLLIQICTQCGSAAERISAKPVRKEWKKCEGKKR